jgi:hypothetical protein
MDMVIMVKSMAKGITQPIQNLKRRVFGNAFLEVKSNL